MRLSELVVTNFRSLKSARIRFSPEATILVGPNNAGKTNILRAVQLVLSADIARQRDAISRLDFSDANRDIPFRITATLVGLTDDDVDTFDVDNLEPIDADGNIISSADDVTVIDENALALRITVVGSYDEQNEDYNLAWYFAKHEELEVAITRTQRRYIGFQYLRGGDSAINWALGLSANSLVRQLLKKQGASVAKEVAELTKAIDDASASLQSHQTLASILDDLSAYIARVLPVSEKPLRYGVGRRSGDELLRGLELMSDFGDSAIELPFSAHGRGSMSAAALMAVLLYATQFQGSLILALEEPEVALHPHLQRLLFHELLRRGVQIIMTTHSPVITASCQPEHIILVRKEGGTTLTKPLVGSANNERAGIEHDLNRVLAEAVFSKAVLLVEGETDAAFLEGVDRKRVETSGWQTLDAQGVSIIEAGNCKEIPHFAQRLKVLGIPLIGLVDNDPGQPAESVRNWGTGCDLFFTWPRHDYAYDLEGIIAFATPLASLLVALCVVVPAADEREFLTALVASAARINRANLHPWFLAKVTNCKSFSEIAQAMTTEADRPSDESIRAVLKGAMQQCFKRRRHMRLLAAALKLDDIPPQVLGILERIGVYLNRRTGAGIHEIAL